MKSKPYDNVTVAALRAAGWKVNMRHFRRYVRPALSMNLMRHQIVDGYVYDVEEPDHRLVIALTGGETQCYLTTPDGKQFSGVAHCSLKDHYCYRTGRTVSLRRALEDFLRQDPAAHAIWLREIATTQEVRKAGRKATAPSALAAG